MNNIGFPGSLIYRLIKYAQVIINILRNQYLKGNISCEQGVKFLASAKIFNIYDDPSSITIHRNTIIAGELITFGHGGQISIGEWCYVGEGSRIWSSECIEIGNRVLISHNVNIHDTNSHPIEKQLRHEHFVQIYEHGHPKKAPWIDAKKIVIGDDVWIGFNSTILKGVVIGEGSIIGAGSLVVKDVPPNTIVAGNPAQIIRKII